MCDEISDTHGTGVCCKYWFRNRRISVLDHASATFRWHHHPRQHHLVRVVGALQLDGAGDVQGDGAAVGLQGEDEDLTVWMPDGDLGFVILVREVDGRGSGGHDGSGGWDMVGVYTVGSGSEMVDLVVVDGHLGLLLDGKAVGVPTTVCSANSPDLGGLVPPGVSIVSRQAVPAPLARFVPS